MFICKRGKLTRANITFLLLTTFSTQMNLSPIMFCFSLAKIPEKARKIYISSTEKPWSVQKWFGILNRQYFCFLINRATFSCGLLLLQCVTLLQMFTLPTWTPCIQALFTSPDLKLTVVEIYEWFKSTFAYFKMKCKTSWKVITIFNKILWSHFWKKRKNCCTVC